MFVDTFFSFEGFIIALALSISGFVTFCSLFTVIKEIDIIISFLFFLFLLTFLFQKVVSLVDLESDFINPTDMCKRTNQLVIPEYVAHGVLVIILLLSGFWIEFVVNVPILCYNLYRYNPKNQYQLN